MTSSLFDQIEESAAFLRARGIDGLDGAIVLGTGLGGLTAQMEILQSIAYDDIPHFPEATVEFHSGKLLFGILEGKRVLVMQGRFHYYEGHDFASIAYGIRVFKAMGAPYVLLSGAAGTMRIDWNKGDLMLVTDHIHLLPGNPLIGNNDERLGPRFPDMSEAYNAGLNRALRAAAEEEAVDLNEGVYVSAQGPMLETAAEYRYLRNIGADAVGMSTTPEVIVANHARLPVACVVVLTDECDPDNLQAINIPALLAVAAKAEKKLIRLIKNTIQRIDAERLV